MPQPPPHRPHPPGRRRGTGRLSVRVAVGTDHAGFPLKGAVVAAIRAAGHEVIDLGTHDTTPVDYPDYAEAVARALLAGDAERGVLLCGSGVGAAVAANKVPGVRAATCHDTFSAHQGVEDDDVNVLCMGARVIGSRLAEEIVARFLAASFSGAERHARRVAKVRAIEARYRAGTE
jgi:ribose 5-phosphate isomerase B